MAQQIDIVANLLMKVDGAEAGINKLKNSLSKLEMPKGLENSFNKSFSNLDSIFERYRKQLNKGFDTKADVSNMSKIGKELDAELTRVSDHIHQLTGERVNFKVDTEPVKKATRDLEEVLEKRRQLAQEKIEIKVDAKKEGITNIKQLLEEFKDKVGSQTKAGQAAGSALFHFETGDIEKAISYLKVAENNLSRIGDKKREAFGATGFTFEGALKTIIDELTKTDTEFSTVNDKAKNFQNILAQAQAGQLKDINDLINRLATGYEKTASSARDAARAGEDYAHSAYSMKSQVEQLQQSTQYFFSLRNMFNLLKRGIREAITTVKELDKAMTETAVVTKFDVSDMWAKLPEYTANANALGATVQDMYEATTLYYQQGLNAQQAMSIASETMKMARIGGLEAAEATDMMTAALRGFNMELNETSAQRINDVYSNLAAKTASNTEELGTAMQRTASIAASAGMSFEGTAAFLAQAIETTREPAENLGTAMKTIVARFQELKENPLEIAEVDGEEVSYNKVDAALKTIGVDLKDTNGQFRDLDQVFLDISKKWDSLTQTQQRYIATTAAGSRQQSRFIAMMSNYDRTMELMNYANDSEGASDAQFGKTLDSLEAKLNKFQNAWKEFLMSIMNDSWTKGLVDTGTKVLNIINKIIDTLSLGGKLKGVQSLLSLFTAFTGLKLAGRGINRLMGGLGGLVDPNSTAKQGFMSGGLGSQASKISSPIVKAIYDLIPHIDKSVTNGKYKYQNYGDYKAAQKELAKSILPQQAKVGDKTYTQLENGTYSFSGINSLINNNKLNQEQQKALLASFPGLKRNMTVALSKMLKDFGNDPSTTRNLVKSFKSGAPLEKVLEEGGLLTDISGKMAQMEKEAAEQFRKEERKAIAQQEGKRILAEGKNLGKSGKDLGTYYNQELDKLLNQKRYATSEKASAAMAAPLQLSDAEKLANSLNKIGGAFNSAGMSLQMFGAQLSATNPIVGEVITKLGSLVMMLGTIPNAIGAIAAGGPVVWGIAGALAVLGGIYATFNIHAKKIKKSAEEIAKTFKDTNKETEQNISTLKQYQEQVSRWADGVDAYGNNVNLSDEDYSQYLQAVEEIAKINPSIVEGYNAQGHAIVNINKALSETLKLEQQRQKEALDEYLDPASLDKLVKARDVDSNFLKSATTLNDFTASYLKGYSKAYGPFASVAEKLMGKAAKLANEKLGIDWFVKDTTPFADNIKNITSQLQKDLKTKDLSGLLSQFNIDWEKLSQNDATEISKFVRKRNDIYSAALKANQGELSRKTTEAFTTLDDDSAAFMESVDNVLQWLRTSVSQSPAFKDLPDDIKAGVTQGLEDIAIRPDLDATQMQEQADLLIKQFDNLAYEGSDYANAMKEVEAAQDEFANSLDASEYADKTKRALTTLNTLLEKYKGDTTAYGQAVAEYLQNQIDKIQKFTEEGTVSLTESLNTAISEISAAEGAYKAFQDATKSDLSTGKDNMKSIYDEITKDTNGIQLHLQGSGDNTLWTGMSALFSQDAVDQAAEEGTEAVQKMLNRIKPMLEDGKKGFDAFWTDMFSDENYEKLKEIEGVTMDKDNWEIHWDDNLNPDVFKEMADALGWSDQFLTSMLNSGRQFANLDFMNVDDVRKALSTDSAVIKGTSTSTITRDDGSTQTVTDMFVTEEYLKEALRDAQIVNPQEQKEYIENILKDGVQIIPGPKDITEDTFQHMGISDLPGLIRTLGDTGRFDRSQIAEYAQQMSDLGLIDNFSDKVFDTDFQDYLNSQDHPELPTISNIDGNVASIASMIATQNGYVTQQDRDAYHQANEDTYGEAGKADSMSELFSLGKNANGENLTVDEYNETLKELNKQSETYAKTQEYYNKQAEKAEANGDFKNAEWFREAASDYGRMHEAIDKYIKDGEKAFQTNQEKEAQAKAEEKANIEESKKTGREQNQDIADEARRKKLAKEKIAADELAYDYRREPVNTDKAHLKSLGQPSKLSEAEQAYRETTNQGYLERQEIREKEIADAELAQREVARANNKEIQQAKEAKIADENAQAKLRREQDKKSFGDAWDLKQEEDLEAKHNVRNRGNESYWRGRTDREANLRPVQTQIDEIVDKNINSSFSKALQNLDPETIAKDPAQTKALSNIYADVMKGRLPTIQDIQDLKISDPLDIDFLKQIDPDIVLGSGGLNIKHTKDKLAGFALDLVGLGDTANNLDLSSLDIVDSAIDKVQNWLTSCYAHINGIEVPEMTSTVNEGSSTVASIAQGAISATFGVEVEGGEQIEEVTTQAEGAADIINQGAKFVIDVAGDKKLKTAADKADKLTKNQGTKNFGVTTSFDSKAVTTGIQAIKSITDTKITVGANADPAYADARSVANKIRNITTTLSVYMRQAGNWSVYIGAHGPGANVGYTGLNNKISYHHVPEAGSLAGGTKKGRVGPRNQGGMTLTGELGYEIAWLPEENRSVILGANGPQMVNLPKSAVVYNHDQSKEIMKKRKSIEAGSMVSGGASYDPNGGGSGGGGTGTGNSKGGGNNKTTQKEEKVVQKAEDVVKNAGTVLVWWENSARQMEVIQKRIDTNQRRFEKLTKAFGTTPKSIQSVVADYRKNLKQQIALSNAQITQAKKELNQFAGSHTNNWRTRKEISYEEKYKEDGETKSRSQKVTVDLSNFIFFNKKTGAYEISQAAINGQAKKNQSKAEAIAQAAEKEINERNNKLKTAEDNLQKAQEALEKLSDDMYETFYRWEKSINKIYLLSQRLDTLGKQQTMQTNVAEIEYAKMSIGIQTAAEAQEKVNKALREQNELLAQEVHGRNQAIVEARQEFDSALNFKTYEDIYKANKDSPTARGDFEAAKMAFNLLSKAGLDSIDTFDYSKALAQLNSQRYSKETYDAIKQILDKIFEKQNNLNDSVTNAQDTVLKVYQQLEEYQTTITDFEEDLLQGIEEEAEKQIDKLDKINSTLTKAYKELIDEVKAKLDERRKQEDNQKTESELSQKQQRLSMLRADTSGGHAVEIAQLEKEIAEAQQNYQRSLEDQLIEKLQQQGDKAEQQRQKQIDLLNIQKDIAKETGTNLAEVKELLKDPTSNKAEIKKAWLTAQGYDKATVETQKKLENDFEVAWAKYIAAWTQKNELMLSDELIGTFKDIGKYDDAIYKKLDTGIINVKLTDAQKKQVGWTATDFAKDGKNFSQLRALGYTYKGSVQAIAATKGLSYVIDQLGASANALIKDGGYTLAQVQKAYNNSDTKKTNKNYMQNAQAVLTKNNKNVATGTLQSNNWAYARSGSTLYAQKWDADKAQWEKDAAQYSIGAISAQQISSFGNLGKQALLDAIQTTPFGNIINKNFASLVKATGLAGKEVNLANGWTGSIGSDGLIYQNHATGVKKWNPSTGKITEDLYNSKKISTFLAVAKRNSETSREYAQVLMNNKAYTKAQLQKMGVKFKTGGLADFTGPAWLDGTPSKPELVLNATDTKNFIALKDVLSKAIGSTHAISNEYGGDTTFEININVDHIANDYDVDKMAERVKKIIVKDSSYRNVTQVRKFR